MLLLRNANSTNVLRTFPISTACAFRTAATLNQKLSNLLTINKGKAMNHADQSTENKKPLCVIAQSKDNPNRKQKTANAATRKHYYEVLEEMKQLYKAKGNELVFERDYKLHPSDKPNSMHCFLTNDFYWHLCCGDDYNFVIRYSAFNLPFTADFNKMCVFREKIVNTELTYEIPVPTMFKRCKRLQDSQFFTIL